MDSEQRIVYTPHPYATPETEASVLVSTYEFILRCAEARNAKENPATGQNGRGDSDGIGTKEDSAYTDSMP